MEHTNLSWMSDDKGWFFAEASDLAIPPGVDLSTDDITVMDPWGRVVDTDWVFRKSQWEATVLSPRLKWVKLVIFND